jgi:tRNA A37 threonylcarbamoyltransferase TsaD
MLTLLAIETSCDETAAAVLRGFGEALAHDRRHVVAVELRQQRAESLDVVCAARLRASQRCPHAVMPGG